MRIRRVVRCRCCRKLTSNRDPITRRSSRRRCHRTLYLIRLAYQPRCGELAALSRPIWSVHARDGTSPLWSLLLLPRSSSSFTSSTLHSRLISIDTHTSSTSRWPRKGKRTQIFTVRSSYPGNRLYTQRGSCFMTSESPRDILGGANPTF